MKFVFRTDASVEIGLGHVMRCLTLATELKFDKNEVFFICRELDGNLIELIETKGFKVFKLPLSKPNKSKETGQPVPKHQNWLKTSWEFDALQVKKILKIIKADWLIVDHYSLDKRWELKLKPEIRFIMVIDDLADRKHSCDILLDQNYERAKSDYEPLLNYDSKILVGPDYSMLRPEFKKLRSYSIKTRMRNPKFENLLISLGGVDRENNTSLILKGLTKTQNSSNLKITIVVGEKCPWKREITSLASSMGRPAKVLINVDNMAELMADSDFSIGAAGSTSWERCALGVPSILVSIAENQESLLYSLAKANLCVDLKLVSNLSVLSERLNKAINLLKLKQKDFILNSSKLVDGNGVSRVKDILYEF